MRMSFFMRFYILKMNARTYTQTSHLQQLNGLHQAAVTNVHGWLDLFLEVGAQVRDELND